MKKSTERRLLEELHDAWYEWDCAHNGIYQGDAEFRARQQDDKEKAAARVVGVRSKIEAFLDAHVNPYPGE